jgi:hypothetical protein
MATIKPTVTDVSDKGNGASLRVVWTPVTEADTCQAWKLPEYSDKSIQVLGTFGGATVVLNGSNDGGVTFAGLNVPAGTAISIASAAIKAVLENTEYVQPVASGGTGQSLTIAMMFHLSQPLRQ